MVAVLIETDERGIDRDATLTRIREQTVPAVKSLPEFVSVRGKTRTAPAPGRG